MTQKIALLLSILLVITLRNECMHGISLALQEFTYNPLALHNACMSGDVEKVQQLLMVPEKINKPDANGWTPLHHAAFYGKGEIARLLLAHKACVHNADNVGRTPLHCAALWSHADIVQLLLNHSAQADVQDAHGQTALHYAVNTGSIATLKMLVLYDHHIPDDWQLSEDVCQNNEVPLLKTLCLQHLASRKLDRVTLPKLPHELIQEIEKIRKLLHRKHLLTIPNNHGATVRDKAAKPFVIFIDEVLSASTLDDLKHLD